MKQSFEAFLQDVFMDDNPTTLDDDFPDDFSDWVANQGIDLIIAYAEKWHVEQLLADLNNKN